MQIYLKFMTSLVILFSFESAFANWTAQKIIGPVNFESNDSFLRKLTEGDSIENGSVITDANSRVLLVRGGSKIWVGSSTKFRIPSTPKDHSNEMELFYGKFRASIQPKEKQEYNFRLKTAVAGVRGTEFFAEVDPSGAETLCTLKGEVKVRDGKGQTFEVTAGRGFFSSPARPSQLSYTDPLVTQKWVSETSINEPEIVSMASYDRAVNSHVIAESLFWGFHGDAYYCDRYNGDMNSKTDDSNKNCFRSHLTPFIQWGVEHHVKLKPRLSLYQTNNQTVVDDHPVLVGNNNSAVRISEAYYGYLNDSWDVRLGIFEEKWSDGVLLSPRYWSPEPVNILGALASYDFEEFGKLRLLYSPGLKEQPAQQGTSPFRTMGALYEFSKSRGDIYLLQMNSGELNSRDKSNLTGKKITSVGSSGGGIWSLPTSEGAQDFIGYSLSYIGQMVSDEAQDEDKSFVASSVDFAIHYQCHWCSDAKLTIRYLSASRYFDPTFEEPYQVGYGLLIGKRSNLQQVRYRIDKRIRESDWLYLEYLDSTELSRNGFYRHTLSDRNYQWAGGEWNLVHKRDWNENWVSHVGLYLFDPATTRGDSDAYGFFARLDYTY
ncbi:MAG: FecR domain-containing protein [Bdellovibrionales bacterium]|nr:FecR domain-containing protein [Bdellovibrionales bacterium]